MAKVFIEETTLTAIGDAIREKDSTTELIPVTDMATRIKAISGGGNEPYFKDEDLTFTDNCNYLFYGHKWQTVIEKDRHRIKIVNPTSLQYAFANCENIEDLSWLTIECNPEDDIGINSMFAECRNLKKLPKFRNLYVNTTQCSSLFIAMERLSDPNEIIAFFDNATFKNASMQGIHLFYGWLSMRNGDTIMPYVKKAFANFNSTFAYDWGLGASSLDEVNNIPVIGVNTSNKFTNFFSSASRLKNITFETNIDGSPIVANWKSQNIDLSKNQGYFQSLNTAKSVEYGGISYQDKIVTDQASYEALKNDPDWFTADVNYSRYNHDSAVNTINSLPDTSAYLAANGGTNTIKFKGAAGGLTEGGAISSLTPEEIAIASSKGWTVSLV